MSNLEKIQKTMKVFQILTKIVMVVAFVAAACTLIGGSIVLMADSLPFSEFLQNMFVDVGQISSRQEFGMILICESITLFLGAIVSICVYRYFKFELCEGTPFTEFGARRITKLGIIFIVTDILTAAFSSAVEKVSFISERLDNSGSITFGICLILLAMVVRYGAELEQKDKENEMNNRTWK